MWTESTRDLNARSDHRVSDSKEGPARHLTVHQPPGQLAPGLAHDAVDLLLLSL